MGKICSYKGFDFFNVKLEMTSKLLFNFCYTFLQASEISSHFV